MPLGSSIRAAPLRPLRRNRWWSATSIAMESMLGVMRERCDEVRAAPVTVELLAVDEEPWRASTPARTELSTSALTRGRCTCCSSSSVTRLNVETQPRRVVEQVDDLQRVLVLVDHVVRLPELALRRGGFDEFSRELPHTDVAGAGSCETRTAACRRSDGVRS